MEEIRWGDTSEGDKEKILRVYNELMRCGMILDGVSAGFPMQY